MLTADMPNKLASHVETSKLPKIDLPAEYRYASLPLCVIDAVFSIGVKYGTTQATVDRFCKHTGWQKFATSRKERGGGPHSISDLISILGQKTDDETAGDIFENRQRTSSKAGILKSSAVRLYSEVLSDSGIQTFMDLSPVKLELAEAGVLSLPGQSSGISFDYFRMLAGDDNLVKPDRMVQRYVANALNLDRAPTPRLTSILVRLAARELSRRGHYWTPLQLDYSVWTHQRTVTD